MFATSFCLLSVGVTINGWLGYFSTVDTARSQLTNRRKTVAPQHGKLVSVTTGNRVSGFSHRRE